MNHKTSNCHYVARSLTKPWEHKRGSHSRELKFYSFSNEEVKFDSSRKLLAKSNLLTSEQEERFSKLIERPLGIFKATCTESLSLDDYNIYRALFLYFLFQMERFRKVINIAGESLDLETLLEMSEGELNTLSEGMRDKYKVVLINAVEGHVFFFPEVGFFSFPILCGSPPRVVYSLSLPIGPSLALCLVPHGPSEKEINASRNVMMSFSVGLNENYDKVIIPELVNHYSDAEIKEVLNEYRSKAVSHQKKCESLNSMVEGIYSSFGLSSDDFQNA